MSGGVTVRVPATSANLGPGYDCLGIALNLENVAKIELHPEGKTLHIQSITGEGAKILARDERNLFIKAMRHFEALVGGTIPSCKISLANGIPMSRGLGSSAATIVGGHFRCRCSTWR